MVEIAGSLKNLFANAHLFTDAGLSGIANNAEEFNLLGVRIASGELKKEDLRKILFPPREYAGARLTEDPYGFWTLAWKEILGQEIVLPPVPKLKGKIRAAIAKYKLMLIFIPEITENDYPSSFVKPAWGAHLTESEIKRRPLPGRWVLVETVAKPHHDDASGYKDALTCDLGLTTRFNVNWNDCENIHLLKFGKLLGCSRKQVRLMSVEEWNLLGNLFNRLREHRGMELPDLGSTRSVEWCDNAYGSDSRLCAGAVDVGGLACVGSRWPGDPHGHIGFRFLAVLS